MENSLPQHPRPRREHSAHGLYLAVLTTLLFADHLPAPLDVMAESVTLNSYNTSPTGAYDYLRLVPRAQINDTSCAIGTMYVNATDSGNLYFCRDDGIDGEWAPFSAGVWKESNLVLDLIDTSNAIAKHWGIGTSSPEFKLTLENDGGIIAKGAFGSGAALTTAGSGPRFIWYPRKAALRAGGVSGAAWDDNAIGNHSVAFGNNNEARGAASVAAGGQNNTITDAALYGAVGGGEDHRLENSTHNTIGGGRGNSALGYAGSITGSKWNVIQANKEYGAIVGGRENTAGGHACVVGGGGWNSANGDYSAIIGGGDNMIGAASHAVIAGGSQNTIAAGSSYNTITGGGDHWTGPATVAATNYLADYTSIGGGWDHSATGIASTISGGYQNTVQGEFSTIGGGRQNSIISPYAAIGGGYLNSINTSGNLNYRYAFTAGGESNANSGNTGAILGGKANVINGLYNTILGGDSNASGGTYSVVSGGQYNTADGDFSWAGGLHMKAANTAHHAFVWGHSSSDIVISQPDVFVLPTSNVGVGVLAPQSRLHVDGNFRIDNGSLTVSSMPDIMMCATTLQQDPVTGVMGYDLAETFDTVEIVEPGDLLVIDAAQIQRLKKSAAPYDPRAIGFVSNAPAVLLDGRQMSLAPVPFTFQEGTHPPIALSGRVRAKVSLENGPINIGDLLTSSSQPGYAMRATDDQRSFGAIVGKAMEPFTGTDDGQTTSVITILVTRQ
jgi:hypothetical protein